MKNILIACTLLLSAAIPASAQSEKSLPAPSTTGGLTIMESLWQRQSIRAYSPEMLSDQDLSDLLFAASGVNRPESGKLTAPTAINRQEVDLYLFTAEAVYKYIPATHSLKFITEGDHRDILAGAPGNQQKFVLQAPVSLLIVTNADAFAPKNADGTKGEVDDHAKFLAALDAGIMSQNIGLFCAGRKLATVPRAWMDHKAIAELLQLSPGAIVALNHPVGYPAK